MFWHMPACKSFLGILRRRWSLGITRMDLQRLNHAWPIRLPSAIKWQDLWMRHHWCHPPWFQEYSISPAASLHLTWSKLQHGWVNYQLIKKPKRLSHEAQTAALDGSQSAHGYKVNRSGIQSCSNSFTVTWQSTQQVCKHCCRKHTGGQGCHSE